MMELLSGFTTEYAIMVLGAMTALLGVAMLLHIQKEPREAHGKSRK